MSFPTCDQVTTAWTRGILPALSDRALAVLEEGLAGDARIILQGYTTLPSPGPGPQGLQVPVQADPVAFALWRGDDLRTVDDVARAYERLWSQVTHDGYNPNDWQRWYDLAVRDEAFAAMLRGVRAEIEARRVRVGNQVGAAEGLVVPPGDRPQQETA